MEPKKPQGPGRATLLVSAVVLCVVLIGAAYLMRDESTQFEVTASLPAASTLQPLFDRCGGEPSTEVVDGLTRTTCTSQSHPAFMVYQDANAEVIVRAGLMVPMYGKDQQYEERKTQPMANVGLVFTVMPAP